MTSMLVTGTGWNCYLAQQSQENHRDEKMDILAEIEKDRTERTRRMYTDVECWCRHHRMQERMNNLYRFEVELMRWVNKGEMVLGKSV